MLAPQPGKLLCTAAQIDAIVCDAEFAAMVPAPAEEERNLLIAEVFRDDHRETLVVWSFRGRLTLLVGYETFQLLRLYRQPFWVVEKHFATREEARLFVLNDLVARKIMPPLWASYLRGCFYNQARPPRGGDRKSAEARRAGNGRMTAGALGQRLEVSAPVLRSDGRLAADVLTIASVLVPARRGEVVGALLARRSGLRRGHLSCLAAMPEKRRKDLVFLLLLKGKLPRGWQRNEDAPPLRDLLVLPRPVKLLVPALEKKLSWAEFLEVYAAIGARVGNASREEKSGCVANGAKGS